MLLQLQEGGAAPPAHHGPEVLQDWHAWRAAAQELWSYEIGDIVDSQELDLSSKDIHVGVYLNTAFHGMQTVATADFPEVLDEVVAGMDSKPVKEVSTEPPAKQARSTAAKPTPLATEEDEKWQRLLQHTTASAADGESEDSDHAATQSEAQPHTVAEEVPDETLWAQVSARRAGFETDVCARSHDIKVALQGGAWSVRRRGTAVSEVRADVRAGTRTHACCVATHLPKSATFALNTYGGTLAGRLAEIWVHRMAFLVELWQPSTPLAECYSAAALAAFQRPPGTEDLEGQLTQTQARRLRSILTLVPKI